VNYKVSGKFFVMVIGIDMGGPRFFLGHPCPYLRKTAPGHSGMGNGHGHSVQSGSHIPKGISGYGISGHIGIRL
jgi:hypothetical protein